MSETLHCRSSSEGMLALSGFGKLSEREGWYTKWEAVLFVLLLFIVVRSISELIPPFQSPDEVNHIQRAYTLAEGNWLPMREGDAAGGMVDTALLKYTDYFSALPFDYSAKEDRTLLAHTESIKWTSKRVFSDFSNTAVYFPIPYIPQALALNIGERLHLTVQNSYFLARTFSLSATLGILLCALLSYPVPMPLIALFLLPMSLFQMASASMDSVCFAVSLLAASLFMRAADEEVRFGPSLHVVLTICLVVLATVRQNLICFTFLPAVLYTIRRSPSYFFSAGAGFLLAALWSVYLTHGFSNVSPYNITPIEAIKFYLAHPQALVLTTVKTVTNYDLLIFYRDSFIGNFGGLDTPLGSGTYSAFTFLLLLLALVTFQWSRERFLRLSTISLVCGGLVAVAVLFFLLLVAWTPYRAPFIQGVQGRYFVPILAFAGYPLFAARISPLRRKLGLLVMFILLQLSMMSTGSALIDRYFVSG